MNNNFKDARIWKLLDFFESSINGCNVEVVNVKVLSMLLVLVVSSNLVVSSIIVVGTSFINSFVIDLQNTIGTSKLETNASLSLFK